MNSHFGNGESLRPNKEKPIVALWTPGWYSLDPCLKIGEASTFSFYQSPPSSIIVPNGIEFVFFNGLDSEGSYATYDTTILSISHPILGEIKEVDTNELDYRFVLADGKEVEVNAEEEPGVCVSGDLGVSDWNLTVFLFGLTPTDPESFL